MLTGSYYKKGEGFVDVPLKQHKTGLYFRPGSHDRAAIVDCTGGRDYVTVNCAGHRVLDLGGNIGAFIFKAAREGAERVLSFEPEPSNFKVLQANLEHAIKPLNSSTIVEARQQAVADKHDKLELIVGGSYSTGTPSLTAKKGKDKVGILVDVVPFKEVCEEFKPTLLKMDIEGAEYSFIFDGLPESIREFVFEIHGQNARENELMHKCWEMYTRDWDVVSRFDRKFFGKTHLIIAHLKRK